MVRAANTLSAMSETRQNYKIFVEPETKERLNQYLKGLGMMHKDALTRMVEWFLQQDEAIKAGVLLLLPKEHAAEVAALALAKMAGLKAQPTAGLAEIALAKIQTFQASRENVAGSRYSQEKPQQDRRRKGDGAA